MFQRIVIQEDVPVKGLSSFRTGGRARYMAIAHNIDELAAIRDFASMQGLPLYIIGEGTNVLFKDGKLNLCILKLSGEFSKHRLSKDSVIEAGAGVRLSSIINTYQHLEPGLNVFTGLPGTMGGACFGNAGVNIRGKRFSMMDAAKNVYIFSNNQKQKIPKEQVSYKYRQTDISGIITGVEIGLAAFTPFRDDIPQRPAIEPFPNTGCIFKNPVQCPPAGKLIDECGLKGTRIGGAMVSNIHANFILNVENASAQDIIELIELIKNSVLKKTGIELELEIKVVG